MALDGRRQLDKRVRADRVRICASTRFLPLNNCGTISLPCPAWTSPTVIRAIWESVPCGRKQHHKPPEKGQLSISTTGKQVSKIGPISVGQVSEGRSKIAAVAT
jgi:hypothetical protein